MLRRVRILLGARLRNGPRGEKLIAPLFYQASIAGGLCLLVRDDLPPFPYAVFVYTLTAALLAIPLLGDLGTLLRADPVLEWSSTLPARPREHDAARVLHVAIVLWTLALGSLVPAAVLAPRAMSLLERAALPLPGLGLATCLAATLLLLQMLLAGREAGLVLLQTALVLAVVVGLTLLVREHLATLATLTVDRARLFPPAFFARPFAPDAGASSAWGPALGLLGSLAVLVGVRPPPAQPARRGRSPLEAALAPARRLATRFWVRSDERGPFDLVYDALPREREVVLRTYPIAGIPLAFVLLALREGDSAARGDLLAILLFVVGVYLPVLLTHVPASSSADARWILGTAPVSEASVAGGAIKALAVRFLLPLYAALAALALVLEGSEFVLRIALPGFLSSLLALRFLYPICATSPPLSVPPDEVRSDLDWTGVLLTLALVLLVVALLLQRVVGLFPGSLALSAVLALVEWRSGRKGVSPRAARPPPAR